MPNTDPIIGTTLANGTYRIDALVGRGGMARVYLGHDLQLDRQVAIKLIDTENDSETAYAARFLREARAVASLRHHNVVQIYYAGQEGALYYFVMEFIDGMGLNALVKEYTKDAELMPVHDVVSVGRSIASALDYAHAAGVIHRDVKPSNIMIARDGRVILTDFGLAVRREDQTRGEVFGTPHYISPEQARSSKEACPQSDLYSLGVILYELLTGMVPFDDPSSTVLAVQHLTQSPPPPRQYNPDLNQATEAVLLKILEKSPKDRYASGDALMNALEAALEQEESDGVPELPPPPPDADVVIRHHSSKSVKEIVGSQSDKPQTPRRPLGAVDELVGTQLDEYALIKRLGTGGMACVYLGRDTRLNRKVAIKVISPEFAGAEDYLARFEREAQAIASLEHPNIVRLYRYGDDAGRLYMAMQYVEGATLRDVMSSYSATGERVEDEHILRFVKQICSALDYAHQQGIIHRDIKPENILVTRDDNFLLTDFGLALMQSTGTKGGIFGTPHYISPEQAVSSASVVPQSDLYALGVILYEIFTGVLPFDGEDDPASIAMRHLNEAPRLPHQVKPDISPAVEQVILKAMDKSPNNRFTNGTEMFAALDNALGPQKGRSVLRRPSQKSGISSPLPSPAPVVVEEPTPPPQPKYDDKKDDASQPTPPIVPGPKPRKRFPIWAILLIVALLLGGAYAAYEIIGNAPVAPEPTETLPAPTTTATLSPSKTPTVTLAPSSTPVPAIPGINPYAPVSVLLAGISYSLTPSTDFVDDTWEVVGQSEWLTGTYLARVVVLPYSETLLEKIGALDPGDTIQVVLYNGEVVQYVFTGIERVPVEEVSTLVVLRPSLLIVLYGEQSTDRYIVIGDAIQDGMIYPSPTAEGGANATPTP